jgi:glycosyltransferase involved in cell wall biosynthesis
MVHPGPRIRERSAGQGFTTSARLDIFFPLPLTGHGPSYTCGMIARGLASPELEVTVVTPRVGTLSLSPARVIQALPYWARYLPFNWVRSIAASKIEIAFCAQIGAGSLHTRAAYIWPDASLQTIAELKKRNVKIFREMINCHRGTAKKILDDAYTRIGAVPNHTITEASVIAEQDALAAADYVFCPNPMVEASLLANGISASKILPASYGWDPRRLQGTAKILEPYEGITAVFAGTICVRKGCHLLLDYWAKSKVRGRLVLAGTMEPILKEKYADLLARDDVVVLDYVVDIGALYRSADVFVFPTLEEGGPQVTYEACGCGLPVITTPMGAGRIVRHDREGFVLDPYDRSGWIAAIRDLAEDRERRHSMGSASERRAALFHWEAVALRRKRQVLDILTDRSISKQQEFSHR